MNDAHLSITRIEESNHNLQKDYSYFHFKDSKLSDAIRLLHQDEIDTKEVNKLIAEECFYYELDFVNSVDSCLKLFKFLNSRKGAEDFFGSNYHYILSDKGYENGKYQDLGCQCTIYHPFSSGGSPRYFGYHPKESIAFLKAIIKMEMSKKYNLPGD